MTMNCKESHDASGMIREGIPFERIRRITGYLVGSLERFNNAKRAEVRARVKHGLEADNMFEAA